MQERARVLALFLAVWAAGCGKDKEATDSGMSSVGPCGAPCPSDTVCISNQCVRLDSNDTDGDGFASADCDDGDPTVGSIAEMECETACGVGQRTCENGTWTDCRSPGCDDASIDAESADGCPASGLDSDRDGVNDACQVPTVTTVIPTELYRFQTDETITVSGTGFFARATVTLDGETATNVTVVDDRTITFTLSAATEGTKSIQVRSPYGPTSSPESLLVRDYPATTDALIRATAGAIWHVKATGAPGDGSYDRPLTNIRSAIEGAASGDAIVLFGGEHLYDEQNQTYPEGAGGARTGFEDNNKELHFFGYPHLTVIRNWGSFHDNRDHHTISTRNAASRIYHLILRHRPSPRSNGTPRTTNYNTAIFSAAGAVPLRGQLFNCVIDLTDSDVAIGLTYNNNNDNDFTASYMTVVRSAAAGFSGSYTGTTGSRYDHCASNGDFSSQGGTHTNAVDAVSINDEYQTEGDVNAGVYYGEFAWPPGSNGLVHGP